MSASSAVEQWVDGVARLTQPARVVWCDGSKPEYDALVQAMLGDGTLLPLNPRTYPDSYLHRSHPTDVAKLAPSVENPYNRMLHTSTRRRPRRSVR